MMGRDVRLAASAPAPLTFYELAGTVVSIVDGYAPSDRLMAIWKMCADESYDEGDWIVVAGVMAQKGQWRSFSSQWKRALRSANPRPLPYFSKKEMGRRHRADSPFHGWTQDEAEEKANALYGVLGALDHRLAAYCSKRDFVRIVGMSQFDEKYQDPYLMCFFQAVRLMTDHMNSLPGKQKQPIMVFDRVDKKIRARAREIWDYVVDACDERAALYTMAQWMKGEPLFMADHENGEGNDHVDIGLQAADAVAWHVRNGLTRQKKGLGWKIPTGVDKPLLTHRQITKGNLRSWAYAIKDMLFEHGSDKDRRTPWPWQEEIRRKA